MSTIGSVSAAVTAPIAQQTPPQNNATQNLRQLQDTAIEEHIADEAAARAAALDIRA